MTAVTHANAASAARTAIASHNGLLTVECEHCQLLRLQEQQVWPVHCPIHSFLVILDLHHASPAPGIESRYNIQMRH
jgi:hypothetical protein